MSSATPTPVTPYLVVAGAEDGPAGQRVIEAAAAAIGNRLGGELHILHLSPASELRSEATLGLLDYARECLDKIASEGHEATRCRAFVHIRSGTPWREIVDEARRCGASLVVVGTHGRTGVARFVYGSQGEEVLRHAPCPVLVVRDKYPAAIPSEPEIEPPCPECLRVRESSDGSIEWCEAHAERHVTANLHYEIPQSFGTSSWLIRP
jgi:nucleotide-binding universal stress UspA family protein